MDITEGGEVERETMEYAEEETLAGTIALPEQDMGSDGTRRVDVDLDVIWGGKREKGVEGGEDL